MLAAVAALLLAAAPAPAQVPAIRTGGPTLVVCKPDSASRVRSIWRGSGPKNARSRASRLRLIRQCRYRRIQTALERAQSGSRVMILPGVYLEAPRIATADVQLQGTGRFARDTIVAGDRRRLDVIRAEHADGLVITNLTVEEGARSAVAAVDTDGFRLQKLVTRWAQRDGVLVAASGHGLIDNVEAYGNGGAGIAALAAGDCSGVSVELRDVWTYGNVLGVSASGGGGTSTHDSRLVGNSAGGAADSFAPGRPLSCSRWERNEIASNNLNLFTGERQAFCAATPFAQRPKDVVCPQLPAPVGSGLVLHGANRTTVSDNAIHDNWRSGVRLSWVPASARGVTDPALQFDTSNGNRFIGNRFGTPDPNGTDVFWDEEGAGNCWSGDQGPGGAAPTSDPSPLPSCPQGSPFSTGDAAKQALGVPCAAWEPRDDPDPAGCDWLRTPPEPQ